MFGELDLKIGLCGVNHFLAQTHGPDESKRGRKVKELVTVAAWNVEYDYAGVGSSCQADGMIAPFTICDGSGFFVSV